MNNTSGLRVTGVAAGVPSSKPVVGGAERPVSSKELDYMMEDATNRVKTAES